MRRLTACIALSLVIHLIVGLGWSQAPRQDNSAQAVVEFLLEPRGTPATEQGTEQGSAQTSDWEETAARETTPQERRTEPLSTGATNPADNLYRDRHGGGGTRRGTSEVVFLIPIESEVVLSREERNAQLHQQAAHTQISTHAQSNERRRATPNPDDDFLLLRSRGAADATHHAEHLGHSVQGVPSEPPFGDLTPHQEAANAPRNAPRNAPSLLASTQTPDVTQGHLAVQAETRATPSDRTNAPVLASGSPAQATFTPRLGDRSEGAAGLGAPGANGDHGRFSNGARGTRVGVVGDVSGQESYVRWFRDVRRRIADHVTFPFARQVALDQGTTIVTLTITPDGRPIGQPQVVRSSSFADLDAAALNAVRVALPLPSLPEDLNVQGPHTLRIPVSFANPLVH